MTSNQQFQIINKNKKQLVVYDGQEYIFKIPQKDQNLLYKCIHPSCSATLKLNKNKTAVVSGSTTHARHSNESNASKSNRSQSCTPRSSTSKTTPSSEIAKAVKTSFSKNVSTPTSSQTNNVHSNSSSSKLNFQTPSTQPTPASDSICADKQVDSSSASSSPSVHVTSQNGTSEEIDLLKKLNLDLLNRVKALEDELKNTKRKCEELLSTSTSLHLDSKKPEYENKITDSIVRNPPQSCLPQLDETFSDNTLPVSKKPQLLICGDSMSRNFGSMLQELLPEFSVQCSTFPGSPFAFVVKDLGQHTRNFTKRDIVFIFAGSNDIPNLTPKGLEEEFKNLQSVCLKTNVVISSIPYKFHDLQHNCNIFASNQFILSRSHVYTFFFFECNYFLSRNMYTKNGFHLNDMGKKCYGENLHKALLAIKCTKRQFLLPNLKVVSSSPAEVDGRLLSDITCPYLDEISLLECINMSSGDTMRHLFDGSSANTTTHDDLFFLS